MGFSLSPAVNSIETDLSLYVPNVATSTGASVGFFEWGPVEEITLIDSERTLVSKFGKPDASNFLDWYSSFNFLAYSGSLLAVRVVDDAVALNGAAGESSTTAGTYDSANSAGLLIKNRDDWDAKAATVATKQAAFYARYPGAFGNKIKIEAFDSTSYGAASSKSLFSYAPTGDEVFVAVLYAEDGTNYELVEQYYTSKDPAAIDASTQGSNFVGAKINDNSQYIYVDVVDSAGTVSGSLFTGTSGSFTDVNFDGVISSGVDGYAIGSASDNERATGWALFNDTEAVDINLCISGGASTQAGKSILDNVVLNRLDCVVLLSPQSGDVVANATPRTAISTTRNSLGSSSYAFMDGNFKYQYDKYNDVYRWVPLNGDIAGLMALTDFNKDAWWSPAGLNRGAIKNAIKLAFNPTKADRDSLYNEGINPVVQFKGDGIVLFGDKTLQSKPSAFDRINVRRLFLVLEKAIATAAKYQLFEFNDRQTRNAFVNIVEPFLRNIKARRGVYDYRVVADETNNTPSVIDSNQFVADIFIKPTRAINFIQLNFAAVSSSVTFDEVILNK
jgi:hypothetical protein